MGRLASAWTIAIGILLGAAPSLVANDEIVIECKVDFGADRGQSYGTLFEAFDAAGNTLVSAGFMDAYNTQDRSDRRLLHIHLRTPNQGGFHLEPLPRPTNDGGTYLFGFDGKLFALGRGGGNDTSLRRWDVAQAKWLVDASTVPFSVAVANGVLAATPSAILWNGKPLLRPPTADYQFGDCYFSNGWLIVRRCSKDAKPRHWLQAHRWNPAAKDPAIEQAVELELPSAPTVIYAFGQLDKSIIAATNAGGVYEFHADKAQWRVVRQPTPTTSFQIYCSLRYGERLLLGQYPSGEFFEYLDGRLLRLAGWPPVMPNVSDAAREAQTAALFSGKLIVGVWPWGELWELDRDLPKWQFLGRAFTHPQPTKATTHPYEKETRQLDPVLNRWGQRVTSLVPLGDSLYIATSAKSQAPYEPKFEFLGNDRWKEYGTVYRWRRPGSLVVPYRWTGGPSTFRLRIGERGGVVEQDGEPLGSAFAHNTMKPGEIASTRFGRGIYGRFCGVILSTNVAAEPAKTAPFLGTYMDLRKCFQASAAIDEKKRGVDGSLDRMQAAGLNVVMPYANTSSWSTLYPSGVVPDRIEGNWDPVAHVAAGARRRGLKFWPAVCVCACGQFEPRGVLLRHPEWALRYPDGRSYGFINPTHPQAQRWLIDALRELVRKYSPDGIMLDYLRFFNRDWLLDPTAEATLHRQLDSEGLIDAAARRRRRLELASDRLTEFTRALVATLRGEKPELKIGLYTWGPHVVRHHLVGQNWRGWVREGLIDHVNVSGYYYPEQNGQSYLSTFQSRLRETANFAGEGLRPVEATFALGVHTSHGTIPNTARMREYNRAAFDAGMTGVAVFSWAAFEPRVDALTPELFDCFRVGN